MQIILRSNYYDPADPELEWLYGTRHQNRMIIQNQTPPRTRMIILTRHLAHWIRNKQWNCWCYILVETWNYRIKTEPAVALLEMKAEWSDFILHCNWLVSGSRLLSDSVKLFSPETSSSAGVSASWHTLIRLKLRTSGALRRREKLIWKRKIEN